MKTPLSRHMPTLEPRGSSRASAREPASPARRRSTKSGGSTRERRCIERMKKGAMIKMKVSAIDEPGGLTSA